MSIYIACKVRQTAGANLNIIAAEDFGHPIGLRKVSIN